MADAVFPTLIKHCPSPLQAQTYRADFIYPHSQDDPKGFQAIRTCDGSFAAPLRFLLLGVTAPTTLCSTDGAQYLFGRIFSGALSSSPQPLHIQPYSAPAWDLKPRTACQSAASQFAVPAGSTLIKFESSPSACHAGMICGLTIAQTYIDSLEPCTIIDAPPQH